MRKDWCAFLLISCVGVLFSLVPGSVFADTNVSGDITTDTTWTAAASPYVVDGYVTILPDILLTIEPGVTVKMNDSLEVLGTLSVVGAESLPITAVCSVPL